MQLTRRAERLAAERRHYADRGSFVVELTRHRRSSERAVVGDRRAEKLLPLVPRPRAHITRFHGLLAPAAAARSEIVPKIKIETPAADSPDSIAPAAPTPGRRRWAELLKRVYMVDALECPKCHGRMRILAAVTTAEAIERILRHLGLPTQPPRTRPPRAPPVEELFDDAVDSAAFADPPAPDDFAA